ncbi:UNVERIFIED_CONTAM: Inositol 1,4,5-trisphosphate receptor type 2 [Gekko kuhli]
MNIVSGFFSSPFSDNTTSLQTHQPVFIQLLQSAFRIYNSTWPNPAQKSSVESCIKTLAEVVDQRSSAVSVLSSLACSVCSRVKPSADIMFL